MPAVSKAQQKFMGMVHAAQKGDMENPSPEVEKAADSMSDKDAKDFASTSHKGLPDKIKEMVLAELRSVKAIQTDYAKVLDSMEKSLEAYKKSKGTPAEKQHIQQLKTLTAQKKKLAAELNDKVSDMYKDAELKVDEMNTTGGVEGYNTPFAFSGKDSEEKKGKRQADLTGYSVVKESELKGYLAADVVDDIIKLIGSKFVSGEIKNAPNRNYIYLKLTDIKFGSGVVKMLKSQFGINAKVDKTFGNQPSVSFPSNKVISEGKSINEFMMPRDVDSKMKELGINKIPISSQGEKVLQGMVKEKFLDKVTNAERLIYFVESLGNEKFGYRSKGKPLSSLVDRFWNDITSEAIFFGGKMAAYQVAMNIKDMKRNGEQLDSPYQMMKEYFKNFGMEHDRSRVFDSAIRNLEEWMKRNKIQESVNEGRGIKSIQKDLDKTITAIESEIASYKETKGTPQEKKHIDNLKKLHPIKKKLEAELDGVVSGLYRDAELKIEEGAITEKQFKGLEGIPSTTSLEKISKDQKLKIIKAPGNIIDFIVPKGVNRNFWQVIGTGKIQKNLGGNYVLLGKVIHSPAFKSMDDLIDGVNWKSMEDRRRFNESVNEAKEIKWQDVEVGDVANVKAINKTGLIIKTYGRKFHLKFPNGSTKTYDADELTFIKN
jgi:hypothetical protein